MQKCNAWFNNFLYFQALALTESDSWMCPECEDQERNKRKRGKPNKQEEKQKSSTDSAIKSTCNSKKKIIIKEKTVKQKKIKPTSRKYISDEEMSEQSYREPSPITKKEELNTKDDDLTSCSAVDEPVAKPSEEANQNVESESEDESEKCQDERIENENIKRSFVTSESHSETDEDTSSLDESPSIIRIPIDTSHLEYHYTNTRDQGE